MDKPDYVPAHKKAVWLSSEDVLACIREVAFVRNTNGAKAVCWDVQDAVTKLILAARQEPTS